MNNLLESGKRGVLCRPRWSI